MSDQLDTIGEAVDALTDPMFIRERYEIWDGNRNRKIKYHTHRMPSLVDQLAAAAIPGEVYIEETAGIVRRTPQSIPPARVEAINLSLALAAWAADTAWRSKVKLREHTADNLRAIVGGRHDSETAAQLLHQLRRYVYQARVITGWESPPWRPDAPCPNCEQRGLRVRLLTSTAACIECGEVWDVRTIGLLAEHVRSITKRAKLDLGANPPTMRNDQVHHAL